MVVPSRLSIAGAASVLCLALAFTAGCERAPVEEGPSAPTLTELQSQIFSEHCTRCHAGTGAPHGLDLSEGNAFGNLVNVSSSQVPDLLLVEPGSPNDSYLMIKLRGGERMAEGTRQMPLGGSPLSAGEIDLVRQWIADGAANN